MIRLEQVCVRFEKERHTLFRNLNLEVARGETLVVVGPSGLGKSVLLKTIAGLMEPTEGHVFVEGQDLYKLNRGELAQTLQKMGMLFQKNALFDSLTDGENLTFPLRERSRLGEKHIQEKVDEFLEYVDLSKAKKLYPEEISGGMQKRVGIARALILNPEVILYDDPTAGLDPITSKIIVDLILNLKKKFKTTVVAITNDMNRAYQMADQMGVLLEGEFINTGTVDETKKFKNKKIQQFITGDPAFVEA